MPTVNVMIRACRRGWLRWRAVLGVLGVCIALFVLSFASTTPTWSACRPFPIPEDGIDVVYMWVNGSDPLHKQAREDYRKCELDVTDRAPERFRGSEFDELRYSLRSLTKYCPWVRRVYLLTFNSQHPSWLRLDHPKLTVIPHETVFPGEYKRFLPQFNDLAVQLMIDHIPGISEPFVLMNDDYFWGRPTSMSDLITEDGKVIVYLEPNHRSAPGTRFGRSLMNWVSMHALNNLLLDTHFGTESLPRKNIRHGPHAYFSRHGMQALRQYFPLWTNYTLSHRYRDPTDFYIIFFLPWYQHYSGRCVEFKSNDVVSRNTKFAMITGKYYETKRMLDQIRNTPPPLFFTLNDNLGPNPDAFIVAQVRQMLSELYPTPSPFELSWPEQSVARGDYYALRHVDGRVKGVDEIA